MRCERCGFENMPGLTTCVRCSSAMVVSEPVVVSPPRAGWTKRFRPILYWLNRRVGFGVSRAVDRAFPQIHPPDLNDLRTVPYIALSVVPGLGHLAQRRFSAVRLAWAIWAGTLLSGLCFYGTSVGGVLLGLAAAAHAWIVCEAADLRTRIEEAYMRALTVLVVFAVIFFGVYRGVHGLAGRVVQGVYAPYAIPELRIQARDYLLVRRTSYDDDLPGRGTLVLVRVDPREIAMGRETFMRTGSRAFSLVLGFPGEVVDIRDKAISVFAREKCVARVAAPASLPSLKERIPIPAGRIFCLPVEALAGRRLRGQALLAYLRLTWLPEVSAVEGRVFMIYNPLSRRWFVGRYPVEPRGQPEP